MSNLEIIGISGKAGSGKDFVGRAVLRPAGFHQWAFAWPMKTTAVGRGYSYDLVFDIKPPAVRDMLQQIGTEEGWMTYGRNYWVDQAAAWLRTMQENLGLNRFYFSDVRFPHEAQWVRDVGGKLVRMEHGDRVYPLAGTAAANHSSETALDDWTDWDVVVENTQATGVERLREALEPVLPRELYVPADVKDFVNKAIGVGLEPWQQDLLDTRGATPITRDQKGVLGRWRQPPGGNNG